VAGTDFGLRERRTWPAETPFGEQERPAARTLEDDPFDEATTSPNSFVHRTNYLVLRRRGRRSHRRRSSALPVESDMHASYRRTDDRAPAPEGLREAGLGPGPRVKFTA
jgi:hypothetical protein